MGLIKPNNYDKTEVKFSCIASALSHPARRRIIVLIQDGEFITQHTLISYLNLNKASVNRHVYYLKKANLLFGVYHVHFEQLKVNEETLEEYENEIKSLRISRKR